MSSAACLTISGLVLAGWIAGAQRLTTLGGDWPSMHVNSAIVIVLSAFAALLMSMHMRRLSVRSANACAALGALLSAAALWNSGHTLLRGTAAFSVRAPWEMPFLSAGTLLVLAVGQLLAGHGRRANRVAEVCVGAAMLSAIAMLITFLYQAAPSDAAGQAKMSPITAICIAIIGAAHLVMIPDAKLVAIVGSGGPGSQFARRLLPLALAGPVVLGIVRLEAERLGFISREYGVALMVLWTLLLVTAAVIWGAAHANRAEAGQHRELKVQALLAEASEVLGASLELRKTLATVATLTVPRLADWCSITLRKEDGSLENVAVVHQDPAKVAWAKQYQERFPPRPDDAVGATAIMRTGKAETYREIPDAVLTSSIKDPEQLKIVRALGMRSAMSVPLKVAERTVGVLSMVTSESGRLYGDEDLRVAQLVADRCAVAIEQARLFSEVQRELAKRKEAEKAQRKAYEEYRALFEGNPVPMWVFDTDTLRFLAVNDAAVAHYGYAREEFLAMTLRDIRDPSQLALLEAQVREQGDGLRHPHEARHRKKDGTEIEVEATSSALTHGRRASRLTVINDVTARNRAEAALRTLTEELEQRVAHRTAELAVVNRELESFAYSVSHDLRTPLRGLDGFSQALLEDYAERLDDTGKDYLRRIRRGSQRMGDLIDALLELSRVSRGQLQHQPVDLTGLATEILEQLQDRDKSRTVRARVEPAMTVLGDPRLLRALLENLLANAWKFTSRAADACIDFSSRDEGGRVVYMIRDNGAGFDAAYVSKLFGAFQRLHSDREFEGTGVGLATAQRIVHRHGGEIWAEGEVGKGAAFYFTITPGTQP